MLEKLYDIFHQKYSDSRLAWDRMLTYIATISAEPLLSQLQSEMGWLVREPELVQKITRIYDPVLMRGDTTDSLGDLYRERLAGQSTITEKTPLLADSGDYGLEMLLYPRISKASIMDLHAGTGGLLLHAHQVMPNGTFYGVEASLGAYRVALTNFAIHGVRGYVLHADPLLHATNLDSEEGEQNWSYANRWHSQIDKLLPITPPQPK